MSISDPIADMLCSIANQIKIGGEKVFIPHSTLKADIARVLKEEGFVKHVEQVVEPTGFKKIKILLKYDSDGQSVIRGLRRVSRSGRRVYVKRCDVPQVRGRIGAAILSTSKGVLTGRGARVERVGGELLAEVW